MNAVYCCYLPRDAMYTLHSAEHAVSNSKCPSVRLSIVSRGLSADCWVSSSFVYLLIIALVLCCKIMSVCLRVSLCVTLWFCVKTAKRILKILL